MDRHQSDTETQVDTEHEDQQHDSAEPSGPKNINPNGNECSEEKKPN